MYHFTENHFLGVILSSVILLSAILMSIILLRLILPNIIEELVIGLFNIVSAVRNMSV
jgi:hypothetical protein